MLSPMDCGYFQAGLCQSCTWLEVPYDEQLARKDAHVRSLLAGFSGIEWSSIHRSPQEHFRNKAKMMIGGSAEEPTLGIVTLQGLTTDLRSCPLYEPALIRAFPMLAEFITRARLTPFDIPRGRGELKNIIATCSPAGQLMIRFVLRSTESLVRIEKHLLWLRGALPSADVISVNLLPERKAVPEGEQEIILSECAQLTMNLPRADLYLRPQSFFQTNTSVAAALYERGRAWIHECLPQGAHTPLRLWDLYCGVGGFALYCAADAPSSLGVLGVEISSQAVACAQRSAAQAGVKARFLSGDALEAARVEGEPDIVIVNPPRRGIGDLASWLDHSKASTVLYSSCNPVSLAKDLANMPHFAPQRAQVFDMFPHTAHTETLVLLTREP